MQDTLSFDVAHWLARRIPGNVEIAWDDYWTTIKPNALVAATSGRVSFLYSEKTPTSKPTSRGAHWLDAARPRPSNGMPLQQWLLRTFRATPRRPDFRQTRRTLRFTLSPNSLETRKPQTLPHPQLEPPAPLLLHTDAPLIQRSEVSSPDELSRPRPNCHKLSAPRWRIA
jgi:hypothetical protein